VSLKRTTPLPLLGNQKIMDTIIEEKLHKIGMDGVKYAIEHHVFKNRTYNLQDSYGYAIYRNGAMVGDPVILDKKATVAIKGMYGYDECVKKLNEFKPESSAWTLVVMAGMYYASYVEEYYGLDVLENSYMHAQERANGEFKNINWSSYFKGYK